MHSLVIALHVHLVLAVSDVGQKSGGNTLGWAVQWQMLEVPESHGMTCTAKLRNWQADAILNHVEQHWRKVALWHKTEQIQINRIQ